MTFFIDPRVPSQHRGSRRRSGPSDRPCRPAPTTEKSATTLITSPVLFRYLFPRASFRGERPES